MNFCKVALRYLLDNLLLQVLLAIILAIFVGTAWPNQAIHFQFISIIFIKLIRLIIPPLIFVSIILGICQHHHTQGIGKLAFRTLVYFEMMAIISIFLAFGVMTWIKPGKGFNITHAQGVDISPYLNKASEVESNQWSKFFIDIFPDSILGTLAGHNLLPVIVLALLFSVALLRIQSRKNFITVFQSINQLLFKLIEIIVRFSPFAAFGAIASAIGGQGMDALIPLSKLILTIFLIMILFCCLLGGAAALYGIHVVKLLRSLKEEFLVAFSTSSSESVFPQLMVKLERFGCTQSVVGFVLPTGYSFNLDGTAIYVVAGSLFIQQAYGVPFGMSEFFILLGVVLVISKGAAGVTGAGFITLAATLAALPGNFIPVEGLALLLGIDRFMSDARSMCNLYSNAVGTVIIAKSHGEFDPLKSTESKIISK